MIADTKDLLRLARLSAAVYIDDVSARAAAIAALGLSATATYENADHRAVLCVGGSAAVLGLCGTRFSDGNMFELMDDSDVLPIDLGSDRRAMVGFHRGLADLFGWAAAAAPGAKLDITGHSLGGARSHLAPAFLHADRIGQITSFGAPKAANKAYWASLDVPPRRVVHARDLWAGWPWLTAWGCCHPEPMLWITPEGIMDATETQWPGGLHRGDHDINAYADALAAL